MSTVRELDVLFGSLQKALQLSPNEPLDIHQINRLDQILAKQATFLPAYTRAQYSKIIRDARAKVRMNDQVEPLLVVQSKQNVPLSLLSTVEADASAILMQPKIAGGEILIDSLTNLPTSTIHSSIRITGISNETFRLPNAFVASITLQGLSDCQIWCGPCAGPVYLEDCHRCILHVCGHQVRLLRLSHCSLYVYTFTSIVSESCSTNQIHPYVTDWYEGIEEDFKTCGLNPAFNHWQCQLDFDNPEVILHR